MYITCTAFLASLYILVFHACHLWPHSTCPLLDIPLVFHNHNLHLAPRSCCRSTNHYCELVIRYSFFVKLQLHYKHIRNPFYALRNWKNEAVKNVWGKGNGNVSSSFSLALIFLAPFPTQERPNIPVPKGLFPKKVGAPWGRVWGPKRMVFWRGLALSMSVFSLLYTNYEKNWNSCRWKWIKMSVNSLKTMWRKS